MAYYEKKAAFDKKRDFTQKNNFRHSYYESANDLACYSNKMQLEFFIPSSNVGLIIGRQGSKIKELQIQTFTRISIKQEVRNNYDEVLVVIQGDPSNCEEAKFRINSIISGKGLSISSNEDNLKNDSVDVTNCIANAEEVHEKPQKWKTVYEEYLEAEREKWMAAPKVIKDFYMEDPSVASMSAVEVNELRKINQNIVVESLAGMTEKDDRDPDQIEINPDADPIPNPIRTFHEAFGQYPEIMSELEKAGFEKPSPIQMQAWPIILKGRDLIGIAQTGTGKTLAFLLPAFIHIEGQIEPRSKRIGPTVLIITPTRELALQIEQEVNKYKYRNIKCVCIYGGGSRRDQIDTVSQGVEIVVATPGRLNDLIANNFLRMESVSYVVLDEADRMLDLGFQPDIYKVLYEVRPGRQTIMTTATWPVDVRRLAFKYMRDPLQVFVGSLDLTAVHSVEQRVLIMDASEKYDKLKKFLEEELIGDTKVIIFMTRKATVDHVASNLAVFANIFCASITGDRDQRDREAAIDDIKTGSSKALIATDIASRGIDIKDITHVINYDFPKNIEEYVHRIGRTGRAGRKGVSITYFTRDDWRHASELIKIMEEASQAIPRDLYDMAERFEKMKLRGDRRGQRRRFE